MKKRILSGLLSLCLLLCAAVPMFAFSVKAQADPIVADIYLCHRWTSLPSLGHDWVYIENRSDETLQVGPYALPPRQGVSLGNFWVTRSDGNGTYYNVESWCGNTYGLDGMVATKDTLTKSELDSVSSAVRSFNHWNPIINCSFFAALVWNAGSSKKVVPLLFPVMMKLQIIMYGNVGAVKMYMPERNQVVKQHGIGAGATLSVCSDATVSKKVG